MRTLLYVILGSFLASYLSKVFVDAFLITPVSVIGDWLSLEYAQNPGIAFGILLPSILQPFLIIGAIAILLWVALHSRHTQISAVGFGLILGGALGNIVDRSLDGMVTDFVKVGWFPIFNIADSCITIGVLCLLAEGVWSHLKTPRTPPPTVQ